MVLFITLICALLIPSASYADTGPKPSVNISFSGLDNMTYYVTILSKTSSTGPYSSYEQDSDRWEEGAENYDIFKKFLSYKDSDGYYFLQFFEKCSNNSSFKWGYYPPYDFKILLYFPDSDTFAVSSQAYERYAFDSYYKVDCSKLAISVSKEPIAITAERSYDYSREVLSLAARIIITILTELATALIFKYRARPYIKVIAITNIITQTVLNILLNIVNYKSGPWAVVISYVFLEILVFAIEAVVYTALFSGWEKDKAMYKGHPVLYAFAANTASFVVGRRLANFIPGIF